MVLFIFIGRHVRRPHAPIHGIEGMSSDEVARKVQQGWRMFQYRYVFSVLVYSQITDSDIYFEPPERQGCCCNTKVQANKIAV